MDRENGQGEIIVYQAADHTLKEEEITAAHNAILAGLSKQLKAELRA
mgnify:CR=1 FL=1